MSRGMWKEGSTSMQAVLQQLKDAGRRGLTLGEVHERRPGSATKTSTSALLGKLLYRREADFGEELSESGRFCRRWYAAGCKPVRVAGVPAAPRIGAALHGWGVLAAPSVVSSAQCRPWADAAARGM